MVCAACIPLLVLFVYTKNDAIVLMRFTTLKHVLFNLVCADAVWNIANLYRHVITRRRRYWVLMQLVFYPKIIFIRSKGSSFAHCMALFTNSTISLYGIWYLYDIYVTSSKWQLDIQWEAHLTAKPKLTVHLSGQWEMCESSSTCQRMFSKNEWPIYICNVCLYSVLIYGHISLNIRHQWRVNKSPKHTRWV